MTKGKPKACVVCGCTELRACMPHGCMWISRRPLLCSGCFAFFMNIRDTRKLFAALKHFGLSADAKIFEMKAAPRR